MIKKKVFKSSSSNIFNKKTLNKGSASNICNYFKMGPKRRIIKINGVKTQVILPKGIDVKDFPKELKSSINNKKGLIFTL